MLIVLSLDQWGDDWQLQCHRKHDRLSKQWIDAPWNSKSADIFDGFCRYSAVPLFYPEATPSPALKYLEMEGPAWSINTYLVGGQILILMSLVEAAPARWYDSSWCPRRCTVFAPDWTWEGLGSALCVGPLGVHKDPMAQHHFSDSTQRWNETKLFLDTEPSNEWAILICHDNSLAAFSFTPGSALK